MEDMTNGITSQWVLLVSNVGRLSVDLLTVHVTVTLLVFATGGD